MIATVATHVIVGAVLLAAVVSFVIWALVDMNNPHSKHRRRDDDDY